MRRQSCLHTLLVALTTTILVFLSQGLWAESDPFWNTNHYEWSARTVTAEGRVRVTITKQKPKLHLARYQRPAVQLVLEDDDTDYYDELPDIQVGYRRPELINQTADVELSDEIKLRLAIARMKAMEAYHKKWS